MKYTLLELTQSILSSMDSDEVSSINDTVESQQVVEVIKTVYDDIISRGDLSTNKTLFNLDPSNDNTKPILMVKPEGIDRIEWVKYDVQRETDTAPVWDTLKYLPQIDFIDFMHAYSTTETNVETFNYTFGTYNVTFTYKNDTAPQYFTSFEDGLIFFDAYDAAVDTTLMSSKTLCYGTKTTDFEKSDDYVVNLQPQQFALLLNEAKSLAWAELKQTSHQKAEVTAHRNWRHLQKTRQQIVDPANFDGRAHSFDKLPNFSRRR